jgi:hypothetical protein
MSKDFDVVEIPPVLLVDDLCRIFRCSVAKLDRLLKEEYERLEEYPNNRTGTNEPDVCFPLPIDTGGTKRRRRIWSRDSVERFLAGREQSKVKIETPTQRKQRANIARADLERRGVRVNSEN